jgi:mono/diheme cytochrome c family protein
MLNRSLAPAFVTLLLFAAGCGDSYEPPAGAAPAARYQPRADLMAVKMPDGAPTRWYTPGFPPLRSVRLLPDTPDRDLALDLRKQFRKAILDPTVFEPGVWTAVEADQVARLLDAGFGTPAAPTVRVPTWEEVERAARVRDGKQQPWPPGPWREDWETANAVRAELKLDDDALARGSVVYRRWCLQCHGPTGAGDPAHAVAGGPMPRDYRQGVFKYITAFPPANVPKKGGLGASGKPRRDDLARVVRNGIDGTIMPAFSSLTDQEVEDVVSYVIHLSVRGEVEFATIAKAIQPTEVDPLFTGEELDWLFVQYQLFVLYNWGVAAKHPIPIPPEDTPTELDRLQSAVRGYRLYNSAEFGCASCHADYGRVQQLKWDAWGTIVQPRNLVLGVYRGGRRGEDLYARIYGGITPSGMTAFHDRVVNARPGEQDKIWDIVHFLQALSDPYQRRRMQEMDRDVKLEP